MQKLKTDPDNKTLSVTVNEIIEHLMFVFPTINPNCGKLDPAEIKDESDHYIYRREGFLAYADGTNWNPGSGAGLYRWDGTGWERINEGDTGVGACSTVVTEKSFGQSETAGALTTYSRGDHTHGTPTNPVTAHEAAGDPHTGYQKESEKGAANGYASLGSDTKVPTTELGGSGADATKYLRGDKTWAVPSGGTPGNTVVTEKSFGQSEAAGSSTDYSRKDHTHGTPSQPVDPIANPDFIDDFCWGSGEAGEIGQLGWSLSNGTVSTIPISDTGHPGIFQRVSAASATVHTLHPIALAGDAIFDMSKFDEVTFIFQHYQTSADFRIRLGLFDDSTGSPPANGIYFERLEGDTQWYTVTRAGSTQTRNSTSVSDSLNWIKLMFKKNGSGNIEFYINDVLKNTHSANIPTGYVLPAWQLQPTVSAVKRFNGDFFRLKLKGISR